MWVVTIDPPLPAVRATAFVFYTENEASEFASCLHSWNDSNEERAVALTTLVSESGEPTDVFPSWSF